MLCMHWNFWCNEYKNIKVVFRIAKNVPRDTLGYYSRTFTTHWKWWMFLTAIGKQWKNKLRIPIVSNSRFSHVWPFFYFSAWRNRKWPRGRKRSRRIQIACIYTRFWSGLLTPTISCYINILSDLLLLLLLKLSLAVTSEW